MVLAPSLLASDFANLEREVRRLEEGGAEVLHVDVMDGLFVPNISVGIPVVASLRKITRLTLDVHLMIVDPGRYVEAFRKAGADVISFHIEAESNPRPLLKRIKDLGALAGLALNCGVPVDRVKPYVNDADILLVMSVPAGFGGQTFHYEALESVRALRSLAPDDAVIEIDGGIDENTIGAAAIAGANLLVAGTGVFKASDYGDQMTKLRERALSALRDCGE